MNEADQMELFAQASVAPRHVETAVGDFEFFLGTHHASWLAISDVPLFVSQRRIRGGRSLPRARSRWALDSGGFTELSLHGRYTFTPRDYVSLVRRLARNVGGLAWAASMDFMCEEHVLQRTGLDVAEHQRLTIVNFLELKTHAPELPWAPVLQGWTRGDYLDHLEAYANAGVDLTALPVVAVGTLCRRQHTLRAALLLSELKAVGLKLRAFGFKTTGLLTARDSIVSSDSLAWSLHARKSPPLLDCAHARCSNCLRFALEWRENLLARLR